MTDDQTPAEPWREKPYTILPNSYLLRLAGSDLSGRAVSALPVILTETRGAPGQRRNAYGKDSGAVSAAKVAQGMHCSAATARRAIAELLATGWLTIPQPASGTRGHTVAPLLHRRRRLEPVPAEPEAAPGGNEISAASLEEKKRERQREALRRAKESPPDAARSASCG